MRRNKIFPEIGMVFIAGILLGWILNLLTPQDIKDKSKEEIDKKLDDLRRIMKDPEERDRLKEAFKQKADSVLGSYREAKDNVARALATLKGSNRFDRDTYIDAVRDAIERIRVTGDIDEEQLARLQQYLEDDYDRIRSKMKTS